MPNYTNILKEETLKSRVHEDFFADYGYEPNIDNIDFVISDKSSRDSIFGSDECYAYHYLWAEAKKGDADTMSMLTQLILTCKKTYDAGKYLPPPFIGCLDSRKIVFVPFYDILPIFVENDVNWNATPSSTNSNSFNKLKTRVEQLITKSNHLTTFSFETNEQEIRQFIKENFVHGMTEPSKFRIDKNNFIVVFNKWLDAVKPSIDINWGNVKKSGIIDADFYLADLISEDNITKKDKLFVILHRDKYELDRQIDEDGLFHTTNVYFKDGMAAHKEFWNRYVRPPLEEFWDYIVERRESLLPQDVRERKGAFFTPQQWVTKAHEYLAKIFGVNWQDEYYVWDNSAGTGNLLAGLVNKDRIWASTLDKQDVAIMYDRIDNGANLWEDHVFQFDFLNDILTKQQEIDENAKRHLQELPPITRKLPPSLCKIIDDPKERKKLIILMNPPYGEGGNARVRASKGIKNPKPGVSNTKTKKRFNDLSLGKALNEKYVQFFVRIYNDIPECKMAAFVHPKYICGSSMKEFHAMWKAEYKGGFATPSSTHDNCTDRYAICLYVWDLAVKKDFPAQIPCEVFNEKEEYVGVKIFHASEERRINEWIRDYDFGKENNIGQGRLPLPDAEGNNYCWMATTSIKDHVLWLNAKNILQYAVYFAVRHVVKHKWINDRDQYFAPNAAWAEDTEFHNDSIVYTLFHGQNKIKLREGMNHWIPFTEDEVGCTRQFDSRFMSTFLKNRSFSKEAQAVLDAGKALWCYYIAKTKMDSKANINASFYDIREYFQGVKANGDMNSASKDAEYNTLIAVLRDAMNLLAAKIEGKVYEYGFLK